MPTEQAPMPTKLGSLSLRAHFCRLRPTVVVPLSFIRSAANSRSWHVPLVRGSDVLIGCHLQTDSGVSYNAKHYPAGGTLKPVLTVAVYVCVVLCTCVCGGGVQVATAICTSGNLLRSESGSKKDFFFN